MKKPLPDKEWEIVLCCAKQLSVNPPENNLKEYITGRIDWPVVFALAGKHGLTGFLYPSLAQHCRELMPEAALNQLKSVYFQNSTRNLLLSSCLIKILHLFKQNDIEAIPFKGPVQSDLIYHDIGIRTFSDLDILVKKENAVKAMNLLSEQGFKTCVKIPESQNKEYLENENFFQLANISGDINIDLHWEISGRYNLEPMYYPAEESLTPTLLLGKEIKTLNSEDMLIHLCIHGASHCWDKLELICSVAKIAASDFIGNWEHVIKKSEALRCKRMVLLGLQLARNCFDIDLASAIRSDIDRDPRIEKLSDYVLGKIKNRDVALSERLSWRFSPIHFHVRDCFGDGVKYFLRLFFRPTIREWDKYPLPDSLLFLYRFLRPYRLIKEGLVKQHA
ncbi:MAG: nucleotidyltransferase family protein [Proteobacteria bacterium]|nr:nucleotidyltransferase family protein [Pseudomonadota bacterium]